MILNKLAKIELDIKKDLYTQYQKIETIKKFKDLLQQIDFSAEIVPIDNKKLLTHLMSSLKGNKLTNEETDLVGALIDGNYIYNTDY